MEKDEIVASKAAVRKTRGSKPASLEHNYTGEKSEIGKFINDSYRWFNYPLVTSDEECVERLNEFFRVCNETNTFPLVENMALALGTVRKTVWDWEQGKLGVVRQNIIKKAKEIMGGIDANLVQAGKIPQITYIFRSKNYYGLKDTQEMVLTPNNPLGDITDAETLKQRYLANAPEIVDDD